MAHAHADVYARPPEVLIRHDGEIEIRLGVHHFNMDLDEARKLARDLGDAIAKLQQQGAAS
jgi:hypothetical protein